MILKRSAHPGGAFCVERAGMLKKLMAGVVVAGLALLTFRGFLTPGTAVGDRVATGLTYVALSRFLEEVPQTDAVVLFDEGPFAVDPAWYVITDLAGLGDTAFGVRPSELAEEGALACVQPDVLKGKLIWAMQGDAVVRHLSTCDRRALDIARLIEVATPAEALDFLPLLHGE